MADTSIEVRIAGLDGSSTTIQVKPGTTAAVILEEEALKLPVGYCAHLVTRTLEELESESEIWEPQARPRPNLFVMAPEKTCTFKRPAVCTVHGWLLHCQICA